MQEPMRQYPENGPKSPEEPQPRFAVWLHWPSQTACVTMKKGNNWGEAKVSSGSSQRDQFANAISAIS